MLFSYDNFKLDKKRSRPWIYEGDFRVFNDMVLDGSLIKDLIPDEVTGEFNCYRSNLKSLIGCPTKIGKDFYCSYNKLTSLEGCSTIVGGNFSCANNFISSLQGCPVVVGKDFDCSYNKLTSLIGCPTKVGRCFECTDNQLTSLKGCPISIGDDFYCDNNKLDLRIERDFIMSGTCSSQENFFIDLLKYMIKKKIDLNKITTWPEEFLTPELIQSVSGLSKFNL